MKKLILFLSVLLFLTQNIFSQDNYWTLYDETNFLGYNFLSSPVKLLHFNNDYITNISGFYEIAVGNRDQSTLSLRAYGDNNNYYPNSSLIVAFNQEVDLGLIADNHTNVEDGSSNHLIWLNAQNGNVGIGTKEPESRLHVSHGDIFIEEIYSGIIMK